MDDQVKIRGFRIELGEVEAVLSEHPAVKAVAAMAREDVAGQKSLVAYVVAAGGPEPRAEELRSYLKQKLPDYMVPTRFEYLEELPLSPNGKVNRRALPAPGQSDRSGEKGHVPPRDGVETKLVKIWKGVLNTRTLGVTDNFFELGGHSLLAAKLLIRIEKAFGQKLSMASLFKGPTIEQQAAMLRDPAASSEASGIVAIQPSGSRPPFVCLGGGAVFRPLTHRLGIDQPFLSLALQPSKLDRLSRPYRLEDMATELLNDLREFQPDGPYYIGGYCLSAVLAYEMARQLQAQGQEVALLALFDPPNPSMLHILENPENPSLLARRLKFYLSTLRQVNWKQLPSHVMKRLHGLFLRIGRSMFQLSYKARLQFHRGRLGDVGDVLFVAASVYRPQPHEGAAVLFSCRADSPEIQENNRRSWRELAKGGLEAHTIPGNHDTMFGEPNARVFAEKFKASLVQAQKISSRSVDSDALAG